MSVRRTTPTSRRLRVLLVSVAAMVGCHALPTPDDAAVPDAQQATRLEVLSHKDAWTARVREIAAENDRPSRPAWAGEYYAGTGSGIDVVFQVAPNAGIAYGWSGCFGLHDLNYGTIREAKPDRLIVEFALDTAKNLHRDEDGVARPFLSSELVFVDWGERRYLIPSCRMITFCNDVNDGSIRSADAIHPQRVGPKTDIDAVRARESRELPTGSPSVPAEYREYLLAEPVRGSIRSVLDTTQLSGERGRSVYEVRVAIDRGGDHGLRVGMRLHVGDGESWRGELIELAPNGAVVAFRGSTSAGLAPPRVGDAVCTRR